jgi:hypothetical protein
MVTKKIFLLVLGIGESLQQVDTQVVTSAVVWKSETNARKILVRECENRFLDRRKYMGD